MRRVVAEANVRGRDLGGFVAEARERIAPFAKQLPPGYTVEYGGQFENQQRAMRQLAVVVPVALLLILVLLYLALGSVRDSLLVLLNLPFALVGGVLAVVVFGMPVSVSAAVAFIVLLGIAVQNGVVLVAYFRQLRDRGRDRRRHGDPGLRGPLPPARDDRAHELHRPSPDALGDRLGRRHPEAAGRRRHGGSDHLDDPHAPRPPELLRLGRTAEGGGLSAPPESRGRTAA
jgi:Putative silver efflux pump